VDLRNQRDRALSERVRGQFRSRGITVY